MRRFPTGCAVTSIGAIENRHLLQNRYKSILCQKDPYLLELVRYIHLNPLRAKLVRDLKTLDSFPYAGHSVLMGRSRNFSQEIDFILRLFDSKTLSARRRYRAFVEEGIQQGRRPDLVSGGLRKGLGGWKREMAAKEFVRSKGEERILGDEKFVSEVLERSEEQIDRTYRLKAKGYDLEKLAERVASVLGMEPEEVWSVGKRGRTVRARSLLCYWAVRELGMSATSLAHRLGLTQPAVSISLRRGETIAKERGLEVLE